MITVSLKRSVFFITIIAVVASTPFFGMSIIAPTAILDKTNPDAVIFWQLRFPRAIGAFLVGAGLSLSGLVFQALFRNPLATPFTLGISSGAALGACLYFHLSKAFTFMGLAGSLISALLGCFLSMLLVYGITKAKGGFSTAVMLLAGIIINFFFSSLVMFIQYWSNAYDALQIMRWLMGSLAGVHVQSLVELAVIIGAASLMFQYMAPELDLLTAGEEIAASRGLDVHKTKLRCFLGASIIVGAIVSVTGPIGFVGMMIPQICRLWLGYKNETLIPAAILLGGAFLTGCDLLARTALAPAELPIGIITAMLGAPFFLWTLFGSNRTGYMN